MKIPEDWKKYAVFAIPVIVMLAVGGYFVIMKYRETRNILTGPTQLSQADVKKTVETVGKLILLPQDEVPTLATVSDITKLKDQPFFTNAINGDQVLIYQNAKKAILYRPGENRIIEVAPVNVTPTENATASAITQEGATIPFVLYNGTSVTGLTSRYESILKERVPNAQIVSRDNAAGTYQRSILIDLTGKRRAQADTLARALGMTSAVLPEGENKPDDADFLIIIGTDMVSPQSSPSALPVSDE